MARWSNHVPKTHCPRGHEYTPENTRLHKAKKPGLRQGRACKLCNNEKSKKYTEYNPQHKRRWAWKKQGIVGFTTDDYEAMYKAQNGLCANSACRREIRLYHSAKDDRDACVDHDKVTGRVRGLLCRRCNLGIGFLGDRMAGVFGAVEYLKRFEDVSTM